MFQADSVQASSNEKFTGPTEQEMPRGNGRKNHSVNKERSYAARKAASRIRHKRAEARAKQMKIKSQALAYWREEVIDHP